MSIDLQFQPVHALTGGAILGVATVGKLLLNGRVLGISGSFKGMVTEGDMSPWRFAFLGGLVASGTSTYRLFATLYSESPCTSPPRARSRVNLTRLV